jgi:hypothetical protein
VAVSWVVDFGLDEFGYGGCRDWLSKALKKEKASEIDGSFLLFVHGLGVCGQVGDVGSDGFVLGDEVVFGLEDGGSVPSDESVCPAALFVFLGFVKRL